MRKGQSDLRSNIPHKNFGKKSPKAKKTLNSIYKTSTSNINLSFENEAIKQPFRKNKIDGNFEIIEEPKNGNLD